MANLLFILWRIVRYCLRLAFRLALAASALAGIVLCAILVAVLQREPEIQYEHPISSTEAREGTAFIKRISRKLINSNGAVKIKASEPELQSAMRMVHRAYSGFRGKAHFTDDGVRFQVSLRTNILNQVFFLNARATLKNSENELRWSNSSLGALPLWDSLADQLFYYFVEAALGTSYGSKVYAGIKQVDIVPPHLLLTFEPHAGFQQGIASVIERLNKLNGQENKLDTQRIQYYLNLLAKHATQTSSRQPQLVDVLTFILRDCQKQMELHGSPAKDEALAALYALGIQVGPGVFRHFVADISLKQLNTSAPPRLQLNGREDLAKHFIYSSALKILAERGFSFSLGELKEMLDANGSGSGFSFVDITADKTGIKFTEYAVHSNATAKLILAFAQKGLKESDLFPNVSALPEGLSEEEFKRMFNDVESDNYQALLNDIDVRINQMPMFQALAKIAQAETAKNN